jgi:hypothetical protein
LVTAMLNVGSTPALEKPQRPTSTRPLQSYK